MKAVIGCLWAFVFSLQVSAHDLIVKMKPGHDPRSLQNFLPQTRGLESQTLISEMGLYRIEVDTKLDLHQTLTELKRAPVVEYAQFNHKLSPRKRPNDPSFNKQWSLGTTAAGMIGAQSAWDITTGGKNRRNEDIVIAIVDGGFDVEHPDIAPNVWKNPGEIPGNYIDDDKNGFIDDVKGWNAGAKNGKIGLDNHGTHVAGIASAKGNNGIGISGVNWDAKLMFVSLVDYSTAEVVIGYGYILKQKQLFIQSGGTKGANVVVTNSSFGLDGADCSQEDFPVWDDLFNKMGKVGILSAIAVPNMDWDIDVKGDVPSACPSKFIVSVTNIEQNGGIATDKDGQGRPISDGHGGYRRTAAHGRTSVDLGSPGEAVFSTVHDEYDYSTGAQAKYTEYSGTSMATPHVAGSIALMHAAASENLLAKFSADPGTAALVLKDLLLGSVTPEPQLAGKVVTGGRLNLLKAVQSASSF